MLGYPHRRIPACKHKLLIRLLDPDICLGSVYRKSRPFGHRTFKMICMHLYDVIARRGEFNGDGSTVQTVPFVLHRHAGCINCQFSSFYAAVICNFRKLQLHSIPNKPVSICKSHGSSVLSFKMISPISEGWATIRSAPFSSSSIRSRNPHSTPSV